MLLEMQFYKTVNFIPKGMDHFILGKGEERGQLPKNQAQQATGEAAQAN